MKQIKSFEDLEVFQRGYKLSLELHQLSLKLPKEEQYGLADQLRRASKSICANLAEGYGKQNISAVEFKRFILMSMGSADEMRVWVRYCYDLGYINKEQWDRYSEEYRRIAKMLNSLHREWGKSP
jgi:four helix bundle protein